MQNEKLQHVGRKKGGPTCNPCGFANWPLRELGSHAPTETGRRVLFSGVGWNSNFLWLSFPRHAPRRGGEGARVAPGVQLELKASVSVAPRPTAYEEHAVGKLCAVGQERTSPDLHHREITASKRTGLQRGTAAPEKKALGKARPAPDRSSCAPPADPPGAFQAGPFHLQLRTSLSVASA